MPDKQSLSTLVVIAFSPSCSTHLYQLAPRQIKVKPFQVCLQSVVQCSFPPGGSNFRLIAREDTKSRGPSTYMRYINCAGVQCVEILPYLTMTREVFNSKRARLYESRSRSLYSSPTLKKYTNK